MQGPSSFVVLEAQQIIITNVGVPGNGLFEYTGAPALGNNPQFAIVGVTTTKDPFGNPLNVSSMIIQGNKTLVYDASSNLILSINPGAQTTDSFSHSVYPGFVNYNVGISQIAQLTGGAVNLGSPAQLAGSGGASPGGLSLNAPGLVIFDSGLTATGDSDANLQARSKNAESTVSGVAQRNLHANGPIALSSEASPLALPVATIWETTTGFFKTFPASTTGDSNAYPSGPAISFLTATAPAAQTTPTSTGLSKQVGIGTYWFEADIFIAMGATPSSIELWMAGTATASAFDAFISYEQVNIATAGDAEHWTVEQTTFGTAAGATGRATVASQQYRARIQGFITVIGSGTLVVEQQAGAANTWNVERTSALKLYPQS